MVGTVISTFVKQINLYLNMEFQISLPNYCISENPCYTPYSPYYYAKGSIDLLSLVTLYDLYITIMTSTYWNLNFEKMSSRNEKRI